MKGKYAIYAVGGICFLSVILGGIIHLSGLKAYNDKEAFCMILYDSSQMTKDEHIDVWKYFNEDVADVQCIYVPITSAKGSFFDKLLLPNVLPVTCVFDISNNKMIDLFSGISQESLLYTKQCLKTQKVVDEYHYNQLYKNRKCKFIDGCNMLFTMLLDSSRCSDWGLFDSIFEFTQNPYLLHLKMKMQLQRLDTVSAVASATEFLRFSKAEYLCRFHDEFVLANQLVNPMYNMCTGPKIEIKQDTLFFDNCKVGRKENERVKLTNVGKMPLRIVDVGTSCSCVSLLDNLKGRIIEPGESLDVQVQFNPDSKGDIYREIYFFSNAINSCLNIIVVKAINVV